jgi:hypothetical protein
VRRGNGRLDPLGELAGREGHWSAGEGLEERRHVARQGRLVERHAQRAVRVRPQVQALLARALRDRPALGLLGADAQRVEERLAAGVETEPPQPELQHACERVDAAGDPAQALGAVVDGVHRGHDREQHLRRADVARGLLAPNVLLARLQRQAVGGVALGVLRHPDEPARQVAPVLVACREERGVRPAVTHRDAEPLRGAERHVGAHLARRHEESEGQQIGRDSDERPFGVRSRGERGEVPHDAVGRRVLRQHAEQSPRREVDRAERARLDADPERLRPRPHHRDRLRVAVLRDEEAVAARLRDRATERHRLGRRGRLVEQ